MSFLTKTIDAGALRGIDVAGVARFLGVPYGADTSGDNRFRGPQPVAPWGGVRDALEFGPSAPQVDTRPAATGAAGELLTMLYPRSGSPVEGSGVDEDCLRLNVWAPSDARDLPVLVWLHGGGFTHGSGNEMCFNGDVLAAAGDVVVVTVTHRLGILGFLDLRELGVPESANAGMLDIVAALEWVQRNIAVFGGDPARVTICGQSGGSVKVATLNAMPSAHGLFRGSIMMSGPFATLADPAASAATRATALAGMSAATVEELRSLPLATLLDAQAALLAASPLTPSGPDAADLAEAGIPGFGPSLDADLLPDHPFAGGVGAAAQPLMVGWTTHEAGMFLAEDPSFSASMSDEEADARLGAMGVSGAAAVAGEPPHLRVARGLSALMFHAPSIALAERAAAHGATVWMYEFGQTTEVLGGLLGACHSLDLAYVFGTVDRIPLTGRSLERVDVSRAMMRAWASFVRDGDPGWPSWTQAGEVHAFGAPLGVDRIHGLGPAMSEPLR